MVASVLKVQENRISFTLKRWLKQIGARTRHKNWGSERTQKPMGNSWRRIQDRKGLVARIAPFGLTAHTQSASLQ
jgi:hypothetical protein